MSIDLTNKLAKTKFVNSNNIYFLTLFHFRTIDYVRIFDNGIKAFDYFTSRNFHYHMHNSLRILDCLEPEDAEEYNYNVQFCDWKKYMEAQIIGIRYFFYKESKITTIWHKIMYHM